MVWGFGENPQPGLFGVKNYTVDHKIKKVQAKKKIVKSNKSISRKIYFDQIPFFAIKKWPKSKINF